jgi:coronatine-insensitive protein 1
MLKGKPRAAMLNLIPEDWGGYVMPWVNEIAVSFICLKLLHFWRMIVRDLNLELVL